jgi:hypothetical protein
LCTQRIEVLQRVKRFLQRASLNADDADEKNRLIEEWREISSPTHQYKLVVRFALRGVPALVEEDRRRLEAGS